MMINGDKIVKGAVQSPASDFIFSGDLTAATTTAVGGVAKVLNDSGVDLIITRVLVDIKTASTGAANITLGVSPDGTTGNTGLLSATSAATAAVLQNTAAMVWDKNTYVVSTASATTAGMSGNYTILAVPRA